MGSIFDPHFLPASDRSDYIAKISSPRVHTTQSISNTYSTYSALAPPKKTVRRRIRISVIDLEGGTQRLESKL